jgi:hypothetical protein
MNFGKWITVSFIIFAGFIATLVTVCVRQDIPLVTKEYYQEELAYQEQIGRIENAQSLTTKPVITIENKHVKIEYVNLREVEKGKLKLFRPSNADLDQQFDLKATEGNAHEFNLENAVPGLYKARFTWEQQGKEYFVEQVVVL